jgi:phosphoribosylanthranilate isomerase
MENYPVRKGTIDFGLVFSTGSHLKVTVDQLKKAVAEVGNGIEAVKIYLNKA